MNSAWMHADRDEWIARGASLALHALLFFLVSVPLFRQGKGKPVLLSVETVTGLTPFGAGTGVEGTRRQVSNAPANASPLEGALKLKMDETAAPLKKPAKAKPAVARPPSADELAKRYRDSAPIAPNSRAGREAALPSEGGMGNNRIAGSTDGDVTASGDIGSRGWTAPKMDYSGALPEESEVLVRVVVTPLGEVISAIVEKSSGYPQLNQFAVTRAREFRFNPLAAAETQENKSGTLLFKFQEGGRVSTQN